MAYDFESFSKNSNNYSRKSDNNFASFKEKNLSSYSASKKLGTMGNTDSDNIWNEHN